MKRGRFHIYIIGIFLLNFYGPAAFAQLEGMTKYTGEAKMVTVEPSHIITVKQDDGDYSLESYRDRRGNWGKTISLGYSTYEPSNYSPNFLEAGYDEIYETPELPLFEMQFAIKRNSRSITWGAEMSVGIYQNESDQKSLIQSSLQIIPIKLGGTLMLDALGPEPMFVPYVSGGGYMVLYKEDNNDTSINGNTQIAPYLTAGMAFSLNWIDKTAARISYEDSGIEQCYAFVEARSLFEAGDELDPDFSSQVNFAGGFKVEF